MRSIRPRAHLPGAALYTGLTLFIAGCGEGPTGPTGPEQPITELPRPLSSAEQALVQASNSFAADLLRQVHGAIPDSTVFLSPLSASMALGMTMNGTAGETMNQMRTMLGFGSMSMADIDASYRDLLDLLENLDPRVRLDVADAIFHENGFEMEQPFLDTVRTYFDAEVEGLDFGSPSAVTTINDWVKQATNSRIEKMVDQIPANVVAYLMNAVYFKGDWTTRFDPGKTFTGTFHATDGSTPDVRLMAREDTLPYRYTDAWQAVEIPYGGGAFVMTVAVPREGHTLDDVAADLGTLLDADGSSDAQWRTMEVAVELPRFQLQWERALNDDLKALGMVDAFSGNEADFTPMCGCRGIWVDSVKQKTFLKVDESGTEAAAVTSVSMADAAPPTIRADRPFFLAIRERLTGTVLFEGFIVQAPEW